MARGKKDFKKEALADVAPVENEASELDRSRRGERAGTQRLSGARSISMDRLKLDDRRLRQTIEGESLQKLAESIKIYGVIHPVAVEYDEKDDLYRIITGARRFLAAKKIGLPSMPCIIRQSPVEWSRIEQLVENIHREDLPVLAEAGAIQELCDVFNLSQREVAKRIGKPKTYVNELLKILALPDDVKEQIFIGAPIPKSSLLKLARLNDPQKARKLFEQLRTQGLSTKQLENRKEYPSPKKRGRPPYDEFIYPSPDKRFNLKIKFRKIKATEQDIFDALSQTLEDFSKKK